jgi:hypothetical protein
MEYGIRIADIKDDDGVDVDTNFRPPASPIGLVTHQAVTSVESS